MRIRLTNNILPQPPSNPPRFGGSLTFNTRFRQLLTIAFQIRNHHSDQRNLLHHLICEKTFCEQFFEKLVLQASHWDHLKEKNPLNFLI